MYYESKILYSFSFIIVEARTVAKVVMLSILIYFLAPSYIIAIGIGMPFPNILFPPVGKYFMYDIKNYSCTEQSHEVEKFLEQHGIHTYIVSGYKFRNSTSLELYIIDGKVKYGFIGNWSGHEWVEIDLGVIKIPFDAVSMLPVNPDWFKHYKMITRQEGGWRGHVKLDEFNETETIVKIRV